ncbi:TetR/AcrR family transcriptional regulator [Spirosoma rhododendri]|uniref:TetR/AcrR family transcriptional regulator n=1 Tax=Spirosoma rhododendri TaxID=2728024 RepID=A0A7L5DTG8_9BACT|nr:TetR/AcrR family transcriptional regulator [Spirosoma rhododendri]QJD80731.1 TetR/AcrR family transcriptional regulator [Spirosoma rhododendri]
MQRDRTRTEQRLLDAVEQIITEDGLDQVGVNRVSRQSGITKILIYRYFGGMEGLLQAYYLRKTTPRPHFSYDVEALKRMSIAEIMDTVCEHTLREYRTLRNDGYMLEFLRADLMGNELAKNPLTNERNGMLRQAIDQIAAVLNAKSAQNARPFTAIITCAMSFLVFMSQQKRSILDIDLSTEEGWSQIENSMRRIYKGVGMLVEAELADRAEKPL